MTPTTPRLPEIYMRVKDPRQIQKLMVIQGISDRSLATAVGYKSHAYIGRIRRGEIKTVTPERAVRIAEHFGVGVDDLFVPRLSTSTSQNAKRNVA